VSVQWNAAWWIGQTVSLGAPLEWEALEFA